MSERVSFVYMNREIEIAISASSQVLMRVEDITEIVEPVEEGFLTSPYSDISKLFFRKGVMLIPYEGSSSYVSLLANCRQARNENSKRIWIRKYGMAQGGIVYGVIRPGLQLGWYAVHLMMSADGCNYVDYIHPDYVFLGDNPQCDRIRQERGADDMYIYNGIAFPVTLIDREDMPLIFEGYPNPKSEGLS